MVLGQVEGSFVTVFVQWQSTSQGTACCEWAESIRPHTLLLNEDVKDQEGPVWLLILL